MVSVAIIGAGISGLSTAYYLRQKQMHVTLFEAASRSGGVIQSEQCHGYLVEHGPSSIEGADPLLQTLIQELGLQSHILPATSASKHLFILRDGKVMRVPMSLWAFICSPLFSWTAKLRLLREPFIKPADPQKEESVAEFISRRFGKEFFTYIVDPFVRSVLAGNPQALSMRHALPKFYELEQQYGSLIKGQFKIAKTMKRLKQREGPAIPSPRTYSFNNGLQTLTDALAQSLEEQLRLGTSVTKITQRAPGWVVTSKKAGQEIVEQFDAVVYTAPLYQLATIEVSPYLDGITQLTDVSYPALSILALGFHRNQIAHPLDGLGVLIPASEQRQLLGTLFSSNLYVSRAPADHVLLTNFIGGASMPATENETLDELLPGALCELRPMLGITGEPGFVKYLSHTHSIPQYNLGYERIKEILHALEHNNPGLVFAGNYRRGVSIRESLHSGYEAAQRLQAATSLITIS